MLEVYAATQLVWGWFVPPYKEKENEKRNWRTQQFHVTVTEKDGFYPIIQNEIIAQGFQIDWERAWSDYVRWCFFYASKSSCSPFQVIKRYVRKYRKCSK